MKFNFGSFGNFGGFSQNEETGEYHWTPSKDAVNIDFEQEQTEFFG